MPKKKSNIIYRSEFLLDTFRDFVLPEDTILEIGAGDWRNVDYLHENGYEHVIGIDKKEGHSIEDYPEIEVDVIFTMSTLFLIPKKNDWVFEKIARMAQKYIITIEGETTDHSRKLLGRNYTNVFKPFGFKEVYRQDYVFNKYGVLRVLKK